MKRYLFLKTSGAELLFDALKLKIEIGLSKGNKRG
jgi:hypothetical protein